jgi:hypothetical protein
VSRTERKSAGISGVTVYQRRAGWAYLVDLGPDAVSGERRREYRGGFVDAEAALTAAVQAKQSLAGGQHVPPSRRKVAEFFAEWLTTIEHELKASSYVNYSDYTQAYIVPTIGTPCKTSTFRRSMRCTGSCSPAADASPITTQSCTSIGERNEPLVVSRKRVKLRTRAGRRSMRHVQRYPVTAVGANPRCEKAVLRPRPCATSIGCCTARSATLWHGAICRTTRLSRPASLARLENAVDPPPGRRNS